MTWHFHIENFGPITEGGKITLKPLTLFTGEGGSGKTYAMYAIHRFAQLNFSMRKKEAIAFSKLSPRILADTLNGDDDGFAAAKVRLNPKNPPPFLGNYPLCLPAERCGLEIFFREIRNRRTQLLHNINNVSDIKEHLRDVIDTNYPKPVADFIDYLVAMTAISGCGKNEPFNNIASFIQQNIVYGKYVLDENGNIFFIPINAKVLLDIHKCSSTAKNMFGLWYYLCRTAKKGDVLFIDEPELNMHPHQQRMMARVLAKCVNAGLHVVASTHSAIIVKELNNLIHLSSDGIKNQKELFFDLSGSYGKDEILERDKVAAYDFVDGGFMIPQFIYEQGFGISFDVDADIAKNSRKIYSHIP